MIYPLKPKLCAVSPTMALTLSRHFMNLEFANMNIASGAEETEAESE